VDDGLDIGLCLISPKKNKMIFAGAKIPLYIIRNSQLEIIDADRTSIGYRKTPENASFSNHEISIQGDEQFYLASDGYLSQIGGENQFPLGKKRFQEILQAKCSDNHEEQLANLMRSYDSYRGSEEQIDDILVMGFTVK
jgi:serine phosphatase RsbU (regulator of sigma subunit)